MNNVILLDANSMPIYDVQFSNSVTLGVSEQNMIGIPWNLVVDDASRVYIRDLINPMVTVLDSNGSFLMQIGQKGDGPGEFRNIAAIGIRSDTLILFDSVHQRLTFYKREAQPKALTFSLIRTSTVENSLNTSIADGFFITPDPFLITSNGKLITFFRSMAGNALYRLLMIDQNGIILPKLVAELQIDEQIGRAEGIEAILPTSRKPMAAINSRDEVYVSDSDYFLVQQILEGGSVHSSIFLPFQRKRVDRTELQKEYEGRTIARVLTNARLPEYWPAIRAMLIDDDDRLWISAINENSTHIQWFIMELDGRLLARFEMQAEVQLLAVKHQNIYVKVINPETGVFQLKKMEYQITKLQE